MFNIFVRLIGHRNGHLFSVTSSTTILELKQMIFERLSIPIAEQGIILAGALVEDNRQGLSLGKGGKGFGDAGPDRHAATITGAGAVVRGISASAQGP